MQLRKVVPVENGTVTVRELRVKDVRSLMADAGRFSDMDVKELFLDRLDEAAAFLSPLLDLDGVLLEDLTFTELLAVKDAFMEVNHSFLAITGLAAAFGIGPAAMDSPLPNLTEPQSSLSSEDMAA